ALQLFLGLEAAGGNHLGAVGSFRAGGDVHGVDAEHVAAAAVFQGLGHDVDGVGVGINHRRAGDSNLGENGGPDVFRGHGGDARGKEDRTRQGRAAAVGVKGINTIVFSGDKHYVVRVAVHRQVGDIERLGENIAVNGLAE